jgi:microcystin-dependent protein
MNDPAITTNTPYGIVAIFAGAPFDKYKEKLLGQQGWTTCDGSYLPTNAYVDLYAAIQTYFGSIVQSGVVKYFYLPNLCDFYPRGVNGGRKQADDQYMDPDCMTRYKVNDGSEGNHVGSYQHDATAKPKTDFATTEDGKHTHWVPNVTDSQTRAYAGSTMLLSTVGGTNSTEVAGEHTHTLSGGDEATTPDNMSMWYVIKGY